MMKKVVLIFGLTVLVGLTVIAQKKRENLTTPVNVNYCLPKVAYEVNVTLECTEYTPGPYRNYAEKELGQKPEITEYQERWNIKNIEVKPQAIPDEKAVYSVSASGDYQPILLHLSAEGFLAGVAAGQSGVFNEFEKAKYVSEAQKQATAIDIIKFNTYNNLKEVLDTNYTYQEVDGEMKKIWDPIIRYAPKTEKDNVKEAVSEIYRIRSERVKLLGAENNVPDGKSLAIILKEFDRMERDYLSLFLGKKETRKMVRSFTVVPEKSGEPVVAFRFTEEKGISAAKNVTAQAYVLKVDNVIVPASKPVSGESSEAAIYYRVPATADLLLMKGNEELLQMKAIIPQLGEIKKFPLNVIANDGLFLEFYPEYGALKNIGKK